MYGVTPSAAMILPPGSKGLEPPRKDDKGAIFRITPDGQLDVRYRFDGTLGAAPLGGLTIGDDRTLYGTTYYGGKYLTGTVFRLGPNDKEPTVLWDFMNGWYNVREALPPPAEMLNRAGLLSHLAASPGLCRQPLRRDRVREQCGLGSALYDPQGRETPSILQIRWQRLQNGIGRALPDDGSLYFFPERHGAFLPTLGALRRGSLWHTPNYARLP
jgi:uncharacterized repeat protein (TIGR03803 family)